MSQYFLGPDECGVHEIFPGVQIHTAAGTQMMISVVDLEPNSEVKMHSHPHEQMGYLIEGELEFTIGDEKRTVKPGDVWRIPGGIEHGCRTGDKASRAIDIFHPVREDYL